MADTRETVEFETSTKANKLVLHTYLTRRERRGIKNALFGGKEIAVDGKNEIKASVSMELTDVAEDKTFEAMIVSLNGSSENIVERLLELPDTEADEIKAKIDELTSPADEAKKGNGSKATTA
jgi:aconitase B